VPPKNGFRSNDLRHLFEGSSAKTFADLGQTDALRIREPYPPLDLVPEDAILGGQILVTKEEFLVNGTGEVGEQPLPVHGGKVNQHSGRCSTVRVPHKSLWTGSFERFDLPTVLMV